MLNSLLIIIVHDINIYNLIMQIEIIIQWHKHFFNFVKFCFESYTYG